MCVELISQSWGTNPHKFTVWKLWKECHFFFRRAGLPFRTWAMGVALWMPWVCHWAMPEKFVPSNLASTKSLTTTPDAAGFLKGDHAFAHLRKCSAINRVNGVPILLYCQAKCLEGKLPQCSWLGLCNSVYYTAPFEHAIRYISVPAPKIRGCTRWLLFLCTHMPRTDSWINHLAVTALPDAEDGWGHWRCGFHSPSPVFFLFPLSLVRLFFCIVIKIIFQAQNCRENYQISTGITIQ